MPIPLTEGQGTVISLRAIYGSKSAVGRTRPRGPFPSAGGLRLGWNHAH